MVAVCDYNDDYADPYTPNVDRLVAESADFRKAVFGTSICIPYRSWPFTKQYASSIGMVINELRAKSDPDAIAHVNEKAAIGPHISVRGTWTGPRTVTPARTSSARLVPNA